MKFKTLIFLFALLFLGNQPVFAQIEALDSCDEFGTTCNSSDDARTLASFITRVVNAFLILVGVIAAIILIWGGVQYIKSAGDENQAEQAKRTILYAIIGLILVGLSAAIVNFTIDAVGGRGGDQDNEDDNNEQP